jgi:hypothetical protein
MSENQTISMLEKRRIEAEMLKEVYDVLVARHGKDEAREIIRLAVANSAITQGKTFRARYDHEPDLEDFASHLHLWEKDNALERDLLHKSPDRLEYNITRCEYAKMYRDMGLGEIGHLLSCNRDGSFCIGYSKNIKLTRTQTLMQGASHCDFRYRRVDGA